MSSGPARIRVSVVGLGAVGAWLLQAIDRHRDRLRDEQGVELILVAVASKRDGLVYRERGIEIASVLACRAAGTPLAALEGVGHWPTTLAGLEATETDVLVEVSQSPAVDGGPGLSHLRHALGRGVSTATSNKWPVALAGVELRALAERHRAGFRAESTVMSGTPVLAALTTGLGGATPLRLRGVLNATVNFICSRMAAGDTYADALTAAQAAGLAEPDPRADVDGLDAVAKLMVLSALVFGVQLDIVDVACRGLSTLEDAEIEAARSRGWRLREVATLDLEAGRRSVEVTELSPSDPLFRVDGVQNAVHLEVAPVGEVAINGPGAGATQSGQGVFSDLLALTRDVKRPSWS